MTAPTPNRPRRRGRLLLFAALALLLGLGAALAAVEVALRFHDPLPHPLAYLRGFYRLDAEGRLQTTPGWQGVQHVEGRAVAIRHNALGLRGAEVGPKAAGERRVLVLGDSFVWGMGVGDDEALPARLQQQLRAAGVQATVGNAGMFGTGPREWASTLQRYRPTFQPDLVVACLYVGNDVLDTLQAPLSVVDGWLLPSEFAATARASWRFRLRVASRLWDKVEQGLSGLPVFALATPQAIGPGLPLGEAVFLDRDPARDAELPFLAEVAQRLGSCFDAFRAALGELPALVVLLPARDVAVRDYAAVLAAQNQLAGGGPQLDPALHRRGTGHQRLAQWLGARGLPVLDLGEPLCTAADRQQLYLPTDGHFTPLGCERVAAWLLPAVRGRLH